MLFIYWCVTINQTTRLGGNPVIRVDNTNSFCGQNILIVKPARKNLPLYGLCCGFQLQKTGGIMHLRVCLLYVYIFTFVLITPSYFVEFCAICLASMFGQYNSPWVQVLSTFTDYRSCPGRVIGNSCRRVSPVFSIAND